MGNNKKNLHEELIVEILLRLPVKSLVRFRCVSKSWLSLISNPHFAKSHFELATAPSHRLIYIPSSCSEARSIDLDASLHDDSAALKLNFPLATSSVAFNIRGSCRGFILFSVYPNLFLWNPSTGVHKTISYSALIASKIYKSVHNFTHLYGFGYDASTDDYLVVIASFDHSNLVMHLECFSVRTNSWKEIEGTHFPYRNPWDNKSGLFFNGAIHWLVFRDGQSAVVIIVYDLIERNLSEIPLPVVDSANYYYGDLRVIGGCLGLCHDGEFVEVWVMKEYKVQSSWTKSIEVLAYEVPTEYFSPMCFTKGGEIVGFDGNVGLVKLNDKGEVLEHRAYCHDHYGCKTAMYTESLLSLPSDSGEQRKITNNN